MGLIKGKAASSTSTSKNKAWKYMKTALPPALSYITNSGSALGALLGITGALGGGLGGGSGGATDGNPAGAPATGGGSQTDALENFANSGGMQFLREQGNRQISTNMAARGMLGSGATLRELTKYGQGLGSTYLNQYMQGLKDYAGIGLGAGGLMTQAGQRSESTSTGPKKGLLDYGADLASAYISSKAKSSDRRLKKDIIKVGEYEDGLGIYEWTYKEGFDLPEGRFRGVMADEVKELRPQAYIPNIMGEYAGVNYGAL